MARLPPSRHPLHCGLRIPDLRARDDSPLNGSCHQGVPAICRTRRLPAQRIRRCGLNATFRTRLQQCDGDWSPLSPRCYRVAHAARLGTDTEICDTVRLVGRILKVHAAPVGSPWMWTLAFGHHEDHTPTHGYAATREAAMAAFAKGGGNEPISRESNTCNIGICAK